MIQAKINGKWGALPESMEIPVPEEGELKAFEFLYSFKDAMTGKQTHKNNESLMSIVKVINPDTKRSIEIGLVNGVDQNGNPNPYEIRRLSFHPKQGGGMEHIAINGNGDNTEKYQWMMMTSENEDSPFRDKSVTPIFKNKNYKAEATARTEVRRQRREAMTHANALKGTDLTRAAFLLNISTEADPEILLDDIIDYADKNPKDYFNKVVEDKNADAKAAVAEAISRDIVKIDEQGCRLVWSNNALIIDLAQTEKEQAINEFAEYIATDKSGKAVLDKMKSMVKLASGTEGAQAKAKALKGD